LPVSKPEGSTVSLPTVNERAEILYGEQHTTETIVRLFSGAKTKVYSVADKQALSIAVGVEPIWKAILEAKNSKGLQFRMITELTKDNKEYCRQLMQVAEIRHLDSVEGNFGVSDDEYVATAIIVQDAKPLPKLIYCNISEIVQQQQHFFETLWSKALPAEQRLKEIDLGVSRPHTRPVQGGEAILAETIRMIQSSNEYLVSSVPSGLIYAHNYAFDIFSNILQQKRQEAHRGIKWITNLDDPSIMQIAKKFSAMGMEIRHSPIPPLSFGLSDKEVGLTTEKLQDGRLNTTALFSNDPIFIDHFKAIFEELWRSGQNIEDRSNEIQEGLHIETEVMRDPNAIKDKYYEMVSSANSEIMLVLPTAGAFLREEKMGIIRALVFAADRGVRVRILTPTDEKIEPSIERTLSEGKNIEIRKIGHKEQSYPSEAKTKILVVDKGQYLIIEPKDDSKDTFIESVGLAIYSNSKSTVLSYITLFENLWEQTELYEKLQAHDLMQKEFINVAAHELRTPIQPILGAANLLESEFQRTKKDKVELTYREVELLIRNANRLERLSSAILDVARIESNLLRLNKSRFNLASVLTDAVQDLRQQITADAIKRSNERQNGERIKVLYEPSDINVYADRERISQVVYNILNNAVKFTEVGEIKVATSLDEDRILVAISDTGSGIDPVILDKLFTKFATRSNRGTGLGLFISKSIIEAHNGRIWAENNPDGDTGAKFCFEIPLDG
jgi:two-component system, OmpR family, sensor histidine kinase VicK